MCPPTSGATGCASRTPRQMQSTCMARTTGARVQGGAGRGRGPAQSSRCAGAGGPAVSRSVGISGCLLGMAARQQQQQQQQLLCRGDRRAVCPAERAPCRLCAEPVGWLRECEGAQHRPSLCARLPVMVQQLSQARVWLCVAVCHICVPAGSASSAGCCTPSRTLTGSASPAACSWTNTTCAAAAAASRRRPAPRSATTAAQVQAGQWGQRPWTRTAV